MCYIYKKQNNKWTNNKKFCTNAAAFPNFVSTSVHRWFGVERLYPNPVLIGM